MAESPPVSPRSDNNDSGLGDNIPSEDESLTDSILEYRWDYGRRYHAYCDGEYLYPNDDEEQNRLDLQHRMCNMAHKGHRFLAPIAEEPQMVLELGTGTGIWSIEFADLYPSAVVTGIDLSPIQPTRVPPNCRFQVANYNDGWTFGIQFDFIFTRQPVGSIRNPDKLLAEAFRNLRPGGWLEIHSFGPPTSDDNTIPKSSSLRIWIDNYCEALIASGRDPHLSQKYESMLAVAGYIDIDVKVRKIPQTTWPKNQHQKCLGRLNLVNTKAGLKGYSLRPFLSHHSWNLDELEVLLAGVRRDIADKKIHAYWPLYTVCARKPMSVSGG